MRNGISPEFVQDLITRFEKQLEDSARVNEELSRLNQRLMEAVAKYFDGQTARQ